VPTYNRAATLPRTIESALGQSHRTLEVVISDNASEDGTEEVCRRWAERDSRVRYVRHPVNRGPTANFNFLFTACRGDFVLMLADDDWLDARYVEACLAELGRRPDHVLVAGLALYYRAGTRMAAGARVQVSEATGCARVRSYYRQVDDNGTFYGVVRREALSGAGPMTHELGNDWLQVAAIVFQGRALTLPEVHVHRDAGGTSRDVHTIRATFGQSGRLEGRLPHLFMAARAGRDIVWGRPVYRSLPLGRRLALAATVAGPVIDWRSLAWHLVAPTMAGLGRRPRGRPVWRAFERLTRALGAGRTRLG